MLCLEEQADTWTTFSAWSSSTPCSAPVRERCLSSPLHFIVFLLHFGLFLGQVQPCPHSASGLGLWEIPTGSLEDVCLPHHSSCSSLAFRKHHSLKIKNSSIQIAFIYSIFSSALPPHLQCFSLYILFSPVGFPSQTQLSSSVAHQCKQLSFVGRIKIPIWCLFITAPLKTDVYHFCSLSTFP